jgi:Cu2+-containing amine oxidase
MSGAPVAFKLVPMPSPPLMSAPDSYTAGRAVFAIKNLWVTPHSDAQKFPAGDYVYCGNECTGLSVYAKEVGAGARACVFRALPVGVSQLQVRKVRRAAPGT